MPQPFPALPRLLLAALLALGLGGCTLLADNVIEPGQNSVAADAPRRLAAVPEPDRALHRTLFIADLHSDTLLWHRDILRRSEHGHIDVPRMIEGNLALQVFTLVTDTPRESDGDGNGNAHCIYATSRDLTGMLTFLENRPARAWFDLEARAADQVGKLLEAERRSQAAGGPRLMVVRSAADLERLIARRAAGEAVVGGLLGVEGAHWIGAHNADEATTRAQVRALFERGVRVFAPTHRFDNALGGASEGCSERGLSQQGRWALQEAERLGMVVDLAHGSHATLRDALALLKAPLIVSHTGVQAGCVDPCYPPRNLTDDEIRAVAANGGLVGVGYWPEAVGGNGVADIVRTARHIAWVAQQSGREPWRHVAFGSDFDGAVDAPFDVAGLPILTSALRPGMTEADLRDMAGRNACRVLMTRLPEGSAEAAARVCANAGK